MVNTFKNNIIAAYTSLVLWTGPGAMDIRVNWPHLIAMISGIAYVPVENTREYITNFRIPILDHVDQGINDEHDNNNCEEEEGNNEENDSDDSDDGDDSDDSDDSDDDILWGCSFCGNFTGTYQHVCEHERTCEHRHSINEP